MCMKAKTSFPTSGVLLKEIANIGPPPLDHDERKLILRRRSILSLTQYGFKGSSS